VKKSKNVKKTCFRCKAEKEVPRDSDWHYKGVFYWPPTNEIIWLCEDCRPDEKEDW